MIVLGIDPGTIKAGYGVIDCRGRRPAMLAAGTLNLGRSELAISSRLAALREELHRLVVEHGPTAIVLEKAWVGKNPQSAIRVGEARGVALAVAGENRIPVQEIVAATVRSKLGIARGQASKGDAAERKRAREQGKRDAARAVARLLELPPPGDPFPSDPYDALALALCWDGTTGIDLRQDPPGGSK